MSLTRTADPAQRHAPGRAWAVWGIGVSAYVVAVFQRGSLGVASLEAQHRLGAGAGQLSLFVILQLGVYALMQVPVGVALDRYGTRKLVVLGGVVMAIGQAVLAESHSVTPAIIARVLVGAGDAMTFISILRLIAHWFPPNQAPLVTQLTALTGQLGQVIATYPLVALLKHAGWQTSFLGAAAVGIVIAAASAATIRDAPPGRQVAGHRTSAAIIIERVRRSWHEPGTRLGFWSHFVTQFPGNAFALLWGYPFLVDAEGLSTRTASLLLSLLVVVTMAVGPILGRFTSRWPDHRPSFTLAIVAATSVIWTVLLLVPGQAPLPMLVLLVVVLGTNGPGSMVGMDFARTHNPLERIGSASGIVNMGGFLATLILLGFMGLVLGGPHGTHAGHVHYSVSSFRAAFATQWLLWLGGLVMVLRTRTAVRANQRPIRGV